MISEKVGATDSIGFILNGKPLVPGNPPAPQDTKQPDPPPEIPKP